MDGSLAFACSAKSSGGGKVSSSRSSTSRSSRSSTCSATSLPPLPQCTQQAAVCTGWVRGPHHMGACHEERGAGVGAAARRIGVHAAVHLDANALGEQLPQARDLALGALDEGLSAPPG